MVEESRNGRGDFSVIFFVYHPGGTNKTDSGNSFIQILNEIS